MMKSLSIIIGLIHLIAVIGLNAQSSEFHWEEKKFKTNFKEDYSKFGRVLAVAENYIIISPAKFTTVDDIDKRRKGSVYIYKREKEEWNIDTVLTVDDKNMFGSSVTINNEYAIIGAPTDNDKGPYAGAVYIYKKTDTGWIKESKITGSNIKTLHKFGYSLDLKDDILVVGCASSKNVYLFRNLNGNWVEISSINNPTQKEASAFGSSVATNGKYLIINEIYENFDSIKSCGAVYVYKIKENNCTFIQKIIPSNPNQMDYFGTSVAISNSNLAISTQNNFRNSGSVYIYSLVDEKWKEDIMLVASNHHRNDGYGLSLDMDNDILVVSAVYKNGIVEGMGCVYVYKKHTDGWKEINQIIGSDVVAFDRFGWSVSVKSDKILVGTFRNSLTKKEDVSQSAYLFERK
jgi:hypothetical protein